MQLELVSLVSSFFAPTIVPLSVGAMGEPTGTYAWQEEQDKTSSTLVPVMDIPATATQFAQLHLTAKRQIVQEEEFVNQKQPFVVWDILLYVVVMEIHTGTLALPQEQV